MSAPFGAILHGGRGGVKAPAEANMVGVPGSGFGPSGGLTEGLVNLAPNVPP
jgi:hypothetical protein